VPDERPIVSTVRESDIYRQYAVTLLAVNNFYYDLVGAKFSMNTAQQQLSVLGGVANNYLIKRVGDGTDDQSKRSRGEVEALVTRQKLFVRQAITKNTDFEAAKTDAMCLIEDYYRLLLRHGVCK
jgi:hypothetical protein